MVDILSPPVSLLCKLASIAVHAEEYHSPHGHELDLVALRSALDDTEVKAWVQAMVDGAMAPRKRNS